MNIEKIQNEIKEQIKYYKQINSTHLHAKEIEKEGDIILIAEEQTGGIGTKGRSWHTGQNKNIAMTIIKHPKYSFLIASLDGILIDKETGEMGVLEIKTTEIINSMQYENWKGDKIPDTYYCQVLHYLNVTGYSFVKLVAELKHEQDYQARKTYTIQREEVIDEIKYLEQEEIKFWNEYVVKDIRPPCNLPEV